MLVALALSSVDPQRTPCGDGRGAVETGSRETVSSIDSELTLGRLLRSRLVVDSAIGGIPLSVFLVGVERSELGKLDVGLETPYFAFGPCTPYGFLSRLTSPRLAPASEDVGRSELRLDRTFEAGSTHGFIARLPSGEAEGFATFLYLVERTRRNTEGETDGTASASDASAGPPVIGSWDNQPAGAALTEPLSAIFPGMEEAESELQSRAAGVSVLAGSNNGLAVELLAQAIGFPTPERSDEWFTSAPLFPGGRVLHTGARVSYRRGALSLAEDVAASISSSLPVAFALSTDLGLDTGFYHPAGKPKQRLRLRGQGECVGRDYVTSYESYAADALRARLLGEWQLAAFTLMGQFDVEVGQPSLVPAPFRRLCRQGSVGAELALARFSVGGGLRRRRTDGEDGSVLALQSYFGNLTLTGSAVTLFLELASSRENRKPTQIEGRLRCLAGNDAGSLSGSIIVEENHVNLETDGEIVIGGSTFYARVRADELLDVGPFFSAPSLGSFLAAPGEYLHLTIGTRVRITTRRRRRPPAPARSRARLLPSRQHGG